jgi:hypothetical protein
MDASAVHITALDPRISVAYQNKQFVHDQVWPIVPVDNLSGMYSKYSKQAFRAQLDDLDEGGYPRRYRLDIEPYGRFETRGHGVSVMLLDDTRDNADNPAEIDIQHRNFVQAVIALNREIELINAINTTAIPQNTTLSGASQQFSGATSNPLAEIRAGAVVIEQAIGVSRRDMNLLLPRPVLDALMDNPTLRDYVKYTQNLFTTPIEPANIAAALQIKSIIVAENLHLTSAEGASDTLAYNWPSAPGASIALLFYSTQQPAALTPNFGYFFRSKIGYYPLREVYKKEPRGTLIISEEKRDSIMVEPNAAFLWLNPI